MVHSRTETPFSSRTTVGSHVFPTDDALLNGLFFWDDVWLSLQLPLQHGFKMTDLTSSLVSVQKVSGILVGIRGSQRVQTGPPTVRSGPAEKKLSPPFPTHSKGGPAKNICNKTHYFSHTQLKSLYLFLKRHVSACPFKNKQTLFSCVWLKYCVLVFVHHQGRIISKLEVFALCRKDWPSCTVTSVWSAMVSLYKGQIMKLPRNTKTYAT